MATLAEIAKRAGVTPAVVSRIVNRDQTLRVAKQTRERVEKIIAELDYAPNVAAQSLRSSKSGTLAFILHDVSNPVYGRILQGAQTEASRQGLAILLGDAAVGAESNTRLAKMIAGRGVDGVILQSAGDLSEEILVRSARKDTPVVLLQHRLDVDASLIMLPDRAAAQLAMQHLRGLGHARIGCLATLQGLTMTTARLEGWRAAMDGNADEDAVAYAPSHSKGGHEVASALLARRPDLTALLCFNVVAAVGALRAARAAGLAVPRDLSVIAIHDAPFAGDLAVPLTVVDMPLQELGALAVQAAVAAETVTKTIGTPPALIERESTTAPRR